MRVQEIEKLQNVQMMIKNNELVFIESKTSINELIKWLHDDEKTWRKMSEVSTNRATRMYFEGKANEAESLLLRIL